MPLFSIVDDPCLFSIGYEGLSLEAFINRLLQNNIKTLVDVRRNPISRKCGFSKKVLSHSLEKTGINYTHIPELGIASEKRKELKTQDDYDRLLQTYEKELKSINIQVLKNLYQFFLKEKRIALMCFEENVRMCHRGRIAHSMATLPDWNFTIRHI